MGQEIDFYSMEARRERVLKALHVLVGKDTSLLSDEEKSIIDNYRELCGFGFGRMEVVVVAHRLEGVNWTKHMKRKDLLISSKVLDKTI